MIVDRPPGGAHPEYPDRVYPVDHGYAPDVPAGDGEEQDVCIPGAERPPERFEGMRIAAVRRRAE